MAWSWLFDPDFIANGDLAAADHLRQRTTAPIRRERRPEAGGNGFHETAGIALAGDLHHNFVADAQQRAGLLRQIDPVDLQIHALFLPRDVATELGHGRIPVATFHQRDLAAALAAGLDRATEIAGDARLDRHAGMVEQLHRRLGTRVTGDTCEGAGHRRPLPVTPAEAGVSRSRGDASFCWRDGGRASGTRQMNAAIALAV